MGNNVILSKSSKRSTYFVLDIGWFKRYTTRYGLLKCANCGHEIRPLEKVRTNRRSHMGKWKIWCGRCAVRLGMT